MAKEKKPAMPFYGREFYDDENVLVLSLEEQGAYIRLLWKCWSEGSIPADLAKLAAILRVSLARMQAIWSAIGPLFVPSEADRLANRKVEKVREDFSSYRQKRSSTNRDNALKRWHGDATSHPVASVSHQLPMPSDIRTPNTPKVPIVPDAILDAFNAVREIHDPGDGETALRLLIDMVADGRITEADAPLMVEGMKRWKACADWNDRDPAMLPKGAAAKTFYYELYEWVRNRAWTTKPKPSADHEAEERRGQEQSVRAPKGWVHPSLRKADEAA